MPSWLIACLQFLRHMAATGGIYFYIDVHYSGRGAKCVRKTSNTKLTEYATAWSHFLANIGDNRDYMELKELYNHVKHTRHGRLDVGTFGINYDGYIDLQGHALMIYFAEHKYPEDPKNRSYQISRQRWISHYVRRIQQVMNNVVAPIISLTLQNLMTSTTTRQLTQHEVLEPPTVSIPHFNNGRPAHNNVSAYESMDDNGLFQVASASCTVVATASKRHLTVDGRGFFSRCRGRADGRGLFFLPS